MYKIQEVQKGQEKFEEHLCSPIQVSTLYFFVLTFSIHFESGMLIVTNNAQDQAVT